MTALERLIVGFGVLDLAYVAWVAAGLLTGLGIGAHWQSILAFGLPYPALQAAAIAGVYFAILACGLGLLLRRPSFAWLSYALFPCRVLFALPTLFPLFVALPAIGASLPTGMVFALLVATELARVIVVRIWSCRAMAAGDLAGAAA